MRCSQEPSLIHRDVSTLARVLGVHDLTSKADVRKFMRQDEERHLYLLKEAFLVAQKHDHALAALVILWARLCVDEAYRYMIFGDRLESRVVVAAIDWRRCNCCIVAGLQLICTMLSTYALDVGETMIDEVLPAMFELMAQTHENTLVHELCVRAIKQLSKTFYSAAYEKHLRKFMLVLVRHLPTMHFPSALKAVMHSVTICGTAMARDDIHFSYDEPILEFFVGLLRAGYPRARRFALRWITMSTKAKERPLKPGYFLGSRERALPADVRAGMEEYGWESCDSVRLARCLEAFYDVFKGFTIKRDLRYLGLRLYCIISEDPSAVTFDDFFARRTGIGKRKPRHFGVDCDAWHDVLERCAAVIRGLSRKDLLEVVAPRTLQKRTALDVADVLLLQHSFFTKDTKQRVYIGYDMMQRQTSDPYLAYALTTIKELKKTSIMDIGMSRIRDFYDSDATPFHLALANYIQLRYFLVCYDEGVLMGDEGIWKDISHNVETVRDLCEEYLAVTSLDARDRACVLEIYIALYLLFLGPDEPDTLEQIQDRIQEWRNAVELSEKLWGGSFRGEFEGLGDLILDRLPAATATWREPLRRIIAPGKEEEDEDYETDFDPPFERTFSTVETLKWQRQLFAPLQDDEPFDWAELPRKVIETYVHPQLRARNMHECADCKMRTVLLRRCGRCRSVRYCDSECQLKHWGEHKLTCTPSFSRSSC